MIPYPACHSHTLRAHQAWHRLRRAVTTALVWSALAWAVVELLH